MVVVFTAQEESGRQGAQYLTTHHRALFDNLDCSLTVDGLLWGPWDAYEYPKTPYLFGVFKGKSDTFKARQFTAIVENCAKERNKHICIGPGCTEQSTPIDAFKFPPEAYTIMFCHTPNHTAGSGHGAERNNVGQLIDYVDMLINLLQQVEADYAMAVKELQAVVAR